MVIKPSKDIANNLVSSASKLMETSERSDDLSLSSDEEKSIASSNIEKYLQAWNKRDMESALDCFVDACVYETEDPVFVDTFRGKDALREHLVKNAAALPSACQIILDDLAIFGVKWHLEVNRMSIPNLRGCSMYTMDCDVGLLKSGFDVTKAPVKLPGVTQKLFAAIPSNILQSLKMPS